MKRKRFMRLLMARDIQRNEAAAIARRVADYGSYSALYNSLRIVLAFYPLKMAMRRAGRNIARAGNAFAAAVREMANGFCAGADLSNGEDCAVIHHARHNENRNDAVDALSYSAQYMSNKEHAAAHKLDGNRAGAVYFDDFGENNGNGGQEYWRGKQR